MKLIDKMTAASADIWAEYNKHPFVKGIEDGTLDRGHWVLTEQGKNAAEQVCLRASRAVELAGKDLTDETREIFYQALESITANLTELTKEGRPE